MCMCVCVKYTERRFSVSEHSNKGLTGSRKRESDWYVEDISPEKRRLLQLRIGKRKKKEDRENIPSPLVHRCIKNT